MKDGDSLSLRGLAASLRTLGIRNYAPRLAIIAFAAFISGLAQATLLVLISQVVVNTAVQRHSFSFHGLTFSLGQVVLIAFVLLALYFVGSLVAGLLTATLSAAALAAARRTLIEAYFATDWSVQSEERLGHIQQLATFNVANIASIMTTLAGCLQAILTALALLLAAFVVSPETAVLVLVLGVALSLVLRPLNSRSKRSSASCPRLPTRLAPSLPNTPG